MRHGDNIIFDKAILEVRGARLWNRTTADLVSATVDDLDQQPDTVLGNGSASVLGTAHKGLVVYDTTLERPRFWNGTSWKGFNEQNTSGGQYPDLPLANGKILVGHSDGFAWERDPSYIALSAFGAPGANISFNGYRLTSMATPVAGTDGANKDYVDSVATGLQVKTEAVIGSTAALPSNVYDGGAGTLTASVNSTLSATNIDSGASGVTLVAGAEGVGTRVLIKDEATGIRNGIFRVTNLGSGSTKWVLTRVADSDTNTELRAAYVLVTSGTNAGSSYQQSTPTGSFDIGAGTGTLVWSKFGQQISYSAGNGIGIASNTISLNVASSNTWTAGCLFYGATTSSLGKIDGGAGVANRHLIYDSGNTRPAWSAWALPSTITTNDLYFASSTTAMTAVASRVASRVLITNGSGVPTWSAALPAVTINGANPLLDNQIIPIALGGTGLNHTSSGAGSMLYKSGSTFTATASSPTVGSVAMCTVAGSTVDMVDIFARANTWTNTNTFADATGLSPSNVMLRTTSVPTTGSTTASAALEWQGQSNTAGSIFYHHFRSRASGRLFMLDFAVNSATPVGSSWTNWFLWDDTSASLSVAPYTATANLQLGSVWLHATVGSDIYFPAVGGTVAIRELANTFTAAQTITVGSGVTNLSIARTSEANARFTIDGEGAGGGRIGFGPGGVTPIDTFISRTSAQNLAFTGNFTITKPTGTGGITLNAGTEVTGSGLWHAGLIELAYGGLNVNSTTFNNGALIYKTATAYAQIGGTNAANKFPVSTGSAVNWSGYTLPASVVAGDILYASSASAVTARAKPGSDAFYLGLTSGLPDWKPTTATTATGSGPGGTAGITRAWVTRYTGTGGVNRYTSFQHGLASRNVAVFVRKTDSGDTLTNSEGWATRYDVTDGNNVRVWFPSPPTASDHYVVMVIAA
jgi:hypothetical protein